MKDTGFSVNIKNFQVWNSSSGLTQIFRRSIISFSSSITFHSHPSKTKLISIKNHRLSDFYHNFLVELVKIKRMYSLSVKTHHSYGEVVVHNAVRHRVPSLLLVSRCHIDLPAIQHHLCAVLNVPKDLQEVFALIASEKHKTDEKLKQVKEHFHMLWMHFIRILCERASYSSA